jgi:hypothetical protein
MPFSFWSGVLWQTCARRHGTRVRTLEPFLPACASARQASGRAAPPLASCSNVLPGGSPSTASPIAADSSLPQGAA